MEQEVQDVQAKPQQEPEEEKQKVEAVVPVNNSEALNATIVEKIALLEQKFGAFEKNSQTSDAILQSLQAKMDLLLFEIREMK